MAIGSKISEGRTAEVFEFGEGKVIKLFRKEFSSDAQWDYQVTEAAAKIFSGAPKVYGKAEHGGRPGIIFEKLEGHSCLKEITAKPWRTAYAGKKLAEVQAAMHQVPAEGLREQKVGMIHALNRVKELTDSEKNRIIEYLNKLPEGRALCHGDLHPDNLFFSQRGPVVIDWVTANRGVPACDIARTSLILDSKALPPNTGVMLKIVIGILRKVLFQSYKKNILKLSGLHWTNIELWFLPLAAARLAEGNQPDEQNDLLSLVRKKLAEI